MESEAGQRLFELLRLLRAKRGLTQEQLAEKAGIKYKHYQSIESGRKPDVRLSTIVKLAKGLSLQPWELFHAASFEQAVAESPARYGRRRRKK
jgi:transcriptional regulator with XRE-family HTH domain